MIYENIPQNERPQERCLAVGPISLSLRECLAIVLGLDPANESCELANQIIEKPGKGLGRREKERAFFIAIEISGTSYLKGMHGLGPTGQAKVLAALEIGRRYAFFRSREQRLLVRNLTLPQLTITALKQIPDRYRYDSQEWIGFVPHHRNGETGEFCIVERGARTHINVDPAELFARVLAFRPGGFFLFHNHPSGSLTACPQDVELTQRVCHISQTLGVPLLGHWVVTAESEACISNGII